MIRLFLLLSFLILNFSTYADDECTIDKKMAQQIADNFALENFSNFVTEEFHHTLLSKNDTQYFHLFQGPHSFIMIACDKRMYPVVAWSEESSFDIQKIPRPVSAWLGSFQTKMDFYRENQSTPSQPIALVWEHYSQETQIIKSTNEIASPFLTTTWNQGCFYNSALPEDTLAPCGHLYTGCVATAMAQVMKYYNYPKNGLGSFGYQSNYGWLEADFENAEYDWLTMPVNLLEENDAIAELMAHAAISVSSQFFSNGTGAFDFDARDALVDYFDYDEQMQFLWKNSYQGDWIQLLKAELDAQRPVIYGGVDQSNLAGHTFIFDGYQGDFFHVNWGWGGQYNGYYYLDTLNPAGYHYNYQHDAIIGIKPDISGIIELYGPENLSAEINNHQVLLTWEEPISQSSLELLGYTIFRNDSLITPTIITSTDFLDEDVPKGNHTYSVAAVFIGNGIGVKTSTEVYISGIQSNRSKEFSLYPNPTGGNLYISFKTPTRIAEISIIDMYGKIISSLNPQTAWLTTKKISTENFIPGIYFISISTGENRIIEPIIKK
ncbi:MAG: thiol protease/hemagglutinin PrtT [Bacteroidetes bacterium]|nr:thiol protease/hemagglutinin PrtT [Bacteroidota bacterium]